MRRQAGGSAARAGVRSAATYLALLAAAVGIFLLLQVPGAALRAPDPAGAGAFAAGGGRPVAADTLLHVLLALAVVLAAARSVGFVFRRIGQPAVVGEIAAGLLLGPSLLGRVAPGLSAYLLPPEVAPVLGAISQVGVLLFLFLVGLEIDLALLVRRGQTSVAVSHASIVVPFLLGAGLALYLYPRLSTSDVPFPVFALFLGVSLSVTAFPVLARILTDRGLQGTPLGTLALGCAAVDDVSAWCLLAFVVGVARAEPGQALVTLALAAAYVAVMLVVVRPAAVRFARRQEARAEVGHGAMAAVFLALLLSALATEAIGIHALFGAFLLGALVPHDSALARRLRARLEDVVVVLLLPAFFAFVGLRTEIGTIRGARDWALCALIVLVASLGKFGGSALAARLTGTGWREAAALGVLMNTRGLMELVVLTIGLELGVLSPRLFAMLVIMALVTTFATTPILEWITRGNGATTPPRRRAMTGKRQQNRK